MNNWSQKCLSVSVERHSLVVECRTRNHESSFAAVSKIGHFRSLHWRPCSLSCINEYLAIDYGGNVSDLVLARSCCMARMVPGEAELVSEWTGLSGRAKSVKRFERSNGLATALHKNYLYLLPLTIVTARRRSHSNTAYFDKIMSIEHARWRHFMGERGKENPFYCP